MAFPKSRDSKDMMFEFICKMFKQEEAFTIYAYVPVNLENYPNIYIAEDIQSESFQFSKYFAKTWNSQNKTGTTIVSSAYHHVKWKHILQDEI
jgi:hypothetical protein